MSPGGQSSRPFGRARERLLEIFAPGSRERVLEIGPGTGYYTLSIAAALDGGTLDIFDVSEEFLDDLVRKRETAGSRTSPPHEETPLCCRTAITRSTGRFSSRCWARSPIKIPPCASLPACCVREGDWSWESHWHRAIHTP